MRSPQLLATGTAAINMTPMIDVVFLLIIFFLVSSHLAQQENAVRLDLPKAVSGLEDETRIDTIVVNVLSDGTWQMGGAKVDEREMLSAFRQRSMVAVEPLRLKIRTDETVTYSRIEPILGIATSAGIGDIVFSVYEDRPSSIR